MAAVLGCGRPAANCEEGIDENRHSRIAVLDFWGAAVSHRSAAILWRLLPEREGPVDVSVPGDSGRKKRQGIRLRRSVSLLPVDVTLRCGIPVTTPARTISDLRRALAVRASGRVSPRELRGAIRQAEVLGLPLGEQDRGDRTRSELERAFLRLCRRSGLPRPEVNVRIGPHLVDFLWRDRRLAVETDGYRYHRGRAAFEADRTRDLELRALGYETIRLSQRQVLGDPDRVVAVVRKALLDCD